MSFSQNNGNFLKFEYYIPLRGLNGGEKVLKYNHQIKPEARRRLKLYYETVKNDLPLKIAFYHEILELFGEPEKRFLLYSIYFDPDCELIIADLAPVMIQHLQLNNSSLTSLIEQQFPAHDGSHVKGFLKQYFGNILDLSEGEWEKENGIHNPVTNKLITWLVNFIKKVDANTQELEDFVLNYTKLWNIYFTNPYDITKALILTHKLFELYRQLTPQEIKINFYDRLTDVNHFIGELLPAPYNSPITDIGQPLTIFRDPTVQSQQSLQPYLNKNREFHDQLSKNAVFFQDLGDLGWSELFISACQTPISTRMAYLNEITKRYNSDKVPKFKDIVELLNSTNDTEIVLDRKVLDTIAAENYLFFLDIHK